LQLFTRLLLTTALLTGFIVNAPAATFDPETTSMPGTVFDTDGNGKVVSSDLGYMSAPHIYWSEDNGSSWVELNRPTPFPLQPGHHQPTSIDLRPDGVIVLWVDVAVMEASSPWNNDPVMHWYAHRTYTTDLGQTWAAWDSTVPVPTAAHGWQLYQ
jgi:hypothetical protein